MNTSIIFLQLTKDYYWKRIFSDVQEYCKLYETCQHVNNKTTKFREQYQERARANSKSPEKNPEIPSRKQTMTAAALRDEKRRKQRRKELKEGGKKEGIIHHYLLRIKLYLHLVNYNFDLVDYIDLTDDTCSSEILSEVF